VLEIRILPFEHCSFFCRDTACDIHQWIGGKDFTHIIEHALPVIYDEIVGSIVFFIAFHDKSVSSEEKNPRREDVLPVLLEVEGSVHIMIRFEENV